ncbi:MAG: MATE family efflux transporter [Acidimicrobiaceae bacterium]|nr:MATE family efflux transporter [Acidimicrobiaceae bacterium]MCO4832521.1 MATE family efflux transporter [Acidimicrobiaceae bacterium]
MLTSRLTATDREMFALAIPALGALIAEPLYVLADTAVVGNIGTAELGGLGLAAQVIGTVLSISLFLAYGTTSAVSRLLGAGRQRDAANQAVQGLWIAVAAGIVFAAICFAFAPQMLRLLQASDDVEKFGVRYLRVSVFGFPAMLLVMAGVGYLRGLKDTKRPLYIALGTATGNLFLELFLVFGLGFGVGASALSTVVFQWVGAGFYLWWIGHAASEHDVGWRPDSVALRALGRDGVSLFIRTTSLRVSFIVAAAFAAAKGEASLGAHEIASQLFYFVALALDAIAIAGQAMVGTLLGANDAPRALSTGRRLVVWGIGLGVVASGLLLLVRPVLPDLFTNDPAVIDKTLGVLLLLAIMQPLAGAVFALDGILIGAGDMRFLAYAMAANSVFFLGLLWIVQIVDGGLIGLWIALVLFIAARAVTLGWRIKGDAWIVTGAHRSGT